MSVRRVLIALVAGLALPALLSGCGALQTSSNVTVSPGSLSLTTTSSSGSVTLTNTSGSAVSWTAASSDSRVTLSPSSGSIPAGGSATATVTAGYYGLSKGNSYQASLTFTDSAGSTRYGSVAASFTMTEGGLDACGTSYPSTFAVTAQSTGGSAPPASRTPSGAPGGSSGATPSYVPHQVLVLYNTPVSPAGTAQAAAARQVAASVLAAHGLSLLRRGAPGAPDLVHARNVASAVASLRADPRVAAAQPNYYLHPLATPNDPYLSDEWNMQDFGVPQAWSKETGATNPTVIAIVDTGVQMNHPDLKAKMLPGCDLYSGDADPNPGTTGESWHGTHVAGIAAAIGNNSTGIAGVAYATAAEILPVKIFDDSGQNATTETLVNGIRWAAGLPVSGVHTNPNPADIINISAGVPGNQPVVNDAAKAAFTNGDNGKGSLIVAAAGNGGTAGVDSPANAPDVIAVGSVDSNYYRSSFSNTDGSSQSLATNTGIELMAPGGLLLAPHSPNQCADITIGSATGAPILSDYPPTTLACAAGTSMAAPFVAGVAALVKSQNPGDTAAQLRSVLDASTKSSAYMKSTAYGNGVVCADEAVGVTTTTCGQ